MNSKRPYSQIQNYYIILLAVTANIHIFINTQQYYLAFLNQDAIVIEKYQD